MIAEINPSLDPRPYFFYKQRLAFDLRTLLPTKKQSHAHVSHPKSSSFLGYLSSALLAVGPHRWASLPNLRCRLYNIVHHVMSTDIFNNFLFPYTNEGELQYKELM